MQYGFIKVCAVTPDMRVADVKFNTENIISDAVKAEKNGSQLTVFPELCISGYTCGDLFNQSQLLQAADNALTEICKRTEQLKSLIFVGAPIAKFGKLYNCAVAINCGKILGVIPKTFLPNYNEFYEKRNFVPAEKENSSITVANQTVPFGTKIIFKAENCKNFNVSAEICEDLWVPSSPSVKHVQAGANIICNLSAGNETVGKKEYRRELVKIQSAKLICGYIYASAGMGESTTDSVFAGHDLICENGSVLSESKLFENSIIYSEIDVDKLDGERRKIGSAFSSEEQLGYLYVPFTTKNIECKLTRTFSKLPFVPYGDNLSERAELILSMQAQGLAKRIKHSNSKTAVLGISGGLDSALALLVTVRAFKILNKDLKNIIAVTMPGFGTTGKTYENSLNLIKSLGAESREIKIVDSVLQHFKDIGHSAEDFNVTYENSQARMRTLILMDIANETCGLVVGTGDLSELALGWATYNGDHMSMYGVNCSVPKTLVKYLVKYEAEKTGGECKEVLINILNTEISPELLPPDESGKIAQKTEDLIGPYILHDFFLFYAIRYGFKPSKVRYLAEQTFKEDFDGQTIDRWLKNFYKRFFSQQFKRSCSPDGVKIGSVALSPRGDWRMPSDAVVATWLEDLEK